MRTAESLSPRQQEILTYIQGFVDEHGYPPAIRQIQDSLNISSTSVVAYNLKALETKGVLQREGKVSRGIKLPSPTTPVTLSNQSPYQVPLLGVITAGQPLLLPQEAQETATEFVEVSPEVAPADRLKDVYALRVRGHSMIDALIDDGDIVLLRATNTAENGQMVAALIEDENSVTLKRFYKEGSRVRLQPANITMDPIYVNADQVRVQGRVVGVIRSMFY